MKKSIFAVLTLACVLLAGCSGAAQPNDSGAVYRQSTADESTEQSTDSESTEQSSDESSTNDESSSDQSTDSEPVVEKRPGYKSHELTFPAHDFGRTEYNTKVLDIEPFELKIDLPEEWNIHIPQSKDEYIGGFATVDIMQGNKEIGWIDYYLFPTGKYDPDPNGVIDEITDAGIPYVGIYSWYMLGNVISWDADYKEVNKIGDTIASTCRIYVKDVPEEEWSYGILARNKPVGVYISMRIGDPTTPYDTIEYIAKTIEIK